MKRVKSVHCHTCNSNFTPRVDARYEVDLDDVNQAGDLLTCRVCGGTNLEVSEEQIKL